MKDLRGNEMNNNYTIKHEHKCTLLFYKCKNMYEFTRIDKHNV